ncbi:MAG: helix-turn-helix transcriptional regulator [Microscillaceae bacterium]|jgi:two-component system response regulator NreC|nr:helix-turn-helix transcriptional regulator [Microscillaceae bacterium]
MIEIDEKNQTLQIVINSEHFGKNAHKLRRLIAEENFKQAHATQFAQLTKKEVEVLKLTARGYAIKEVAQHLNIEYETAKTHRKHISQKIGSRNLCDLWNFALAFDLI